MVFNGVVYFLEYKLFEKVDYDVFDFFGVLGVDVNVFISFI